MSKIIVPSKPDWRITISLDDKGQATVVVDDQLNVNPVFQVPNNPLIGKRTMNPLQFATILMDIACSTLKTLQLAAMKGPSHDAKKAKD